MFSNVLAALTHFIGKNKFIVAKYYKNQTVTTSEKSYSIFVVTITTNSLYVANGMTKQQNSLY